MEIAHQKMRSPFGLQKRYDEKVQLGFDKKDADCQTFFQKCTQFMQKRTGSWYQSKKAKRTHYINNISHHCLYCKSLYC